MRNQVRASLQPNLLQENVSPGTGGCSCCPAGSCASPDASLPPAEDQRFRCPGSQPRHGRICPQSLRPTLPRRTAARCHRRGCRADAAEGVRGHSARLRQEVRDRRAHLPTTSTNSTMHSINSDRDRVCGGGAQQSLGAKRRSSFGTALTAVRGGRSRCGDSQFDVLSAVYRRRKDGGALNLSAFSAHAFGSEEEAAGEVLATHAA